MDSEGGQENSTAGAAVVDEEVILQLNSLLEAVCVTNQLVLAEALCPREDGNCLVQSSAFYLKDRELEGFLRASTEFVFPLQIGIPGRVWKHRHLAWHGNGTRNFCL